MPLAGLRRTSQAPAMREDVARILFHEQTILRRLDELAQQITADYEGKELTVVAVLNGSFIFTADLLRRIPLPLNSRPPPTDISWT